MMTFLALCVISATVAGNVYSIEHMESLGAHVYVADLQQVYICDSLGVFTIPDISTGTLQLIISHVGFREETLSITIQGPDTIHLHIGLEAMPIPIEDVEATGERIITPGKRMLQKEEMEVMPGAEKNVFRAIQMVPGVSSASDYLGLFYVRGGELYENKVLFDNVEILAPYHYFGVGSTFNVDLIKDFDFLVGAIPARYGDAVSSVLLLHSKDPDERRSGVVGIDLIEANLTYSCPVSDNLSVILAAKRNYLDFLLTQMGIVEGVLLPYFFDAQGKINLSTQLGDFFISGLHSREGTDIQASFVDQTLDLKMDGSANTGWFGWDSKTSSPVRCQAYAFYSDMDRHMHGRGPTSADTVTEDYNARKYGALVHTEYQAGPVTFALGGGIGRYGLNHTGAKIEDIFYKIGALYYSLEVDTSDHYGYLYAVQRFPIFTVFDCEIGERIDWLPAINKPTLSPRLKLIYRRNPSLFFAYGYLFQTPPLQYPVQEYKPLQARSLSMGTEYLVRPALSAKIELYRKNYENLIRGYGDDIFSNDGDGQASGIEFSLRKYQVGNLFGMISYAYSFSQRTTPYDSAIVTTDVHRPHILNLFLGSRFNSGFRIGIQLQVASGLAYRPVIGREGYGGFYGWTAVYAPDKDRLPYYQRFDIHIGKEFTLWGMRGEFYVTVLNITNRKNIQGYLYNWDYTLRKAIYMLPRVPLFGLRIEF
jgi:hypothetical protein